MNIVIHFYSYIYIHMNKNTILSLFILSNFFKAIPRGLKDFSYQTRDGTCAPCCGTVESQLPDCQGSPQAPNFLLLSERLRRPASTSLAPWAPTTIHGVPAAQAADPTVPGPGILWAGPQVTHLPLSLCEGV